MEITITRALSQLTLLDKRIQKAIHDIRFVHYVKKSSDKVLVSQTREEFTNNQRAKYQSVQSLIALRQEIKSKIVLSNAQTKITVGDKTYTVAEAIERKTSISYEKDLLTQMKDRYNQTTSMVNMQNESAEEKALDIIKTIAGKDVKNIKLEDNEIAKQYLEQNSYELVGMLSLENMIYELDKQIDLFESNIDYVLSESNATTKITISANPDLI